MAHQGAGKWGSPAATDLEEEWSQQVDKALAGQQMDMGHSGDGFDKIKTYDS